MTIYLDPNDERFIESLKTLAENAADNGHKKESQGYYRKMLEILNKSNLESLQHAQMIGPGPDEEFVHSDLTVGSDPDEKLIKLKINLVVGSPLFQKLMEVLKDNNGR